MTLLKDPVRFRCDGCAHELDQDDLETTYFPEMVEALKEDGWEITQLDGKWVHLCVDCTESSS